MAASLLLSLKDIRLTFGATPLFEGADLAVHERARIALVGRNGSGKSTLMKIAAGLIEADRGERFLQPGTTTRYLPQEPDLSAFATVADYARSGLAPGDDAYRVEMLLAELGISGEADPSQLSGGEARRAALAQVLAPEPDVVFLDEPTNHLDLPTIAWLEAELGRMRSAIVLISHDRRFLETLSRTTVWVDRGRTRHLNQGFGAFEAFRDQVLEDEETAAHKLDRKIAMEEDWLRYGVTARRKRNVKRLANLGALREARRTARRAQGGVQMVASEAQGSGKRVIEAKGLAKAYDGRVIIRDVTVNIDRGDRIGIVGPNGAGKTTLIGLLTGTLSPDAGTLKLGTKLEMVTLDQKRESLDPETTLGDALTGGRGDQVMIGDTPRHVVGYMKDFLFAPEQVRSPVKVLSGGERGRLMLARALARPSNLMILDEPTNDLDLETLDLLQELLADYQGTLLLVSHDRDFLDRVVTSTLVAEGDGLWREYPGGFSDMVAQRGAIPGVRLPVVETRPKAVAHVPRAQPAAKSNKLSYKEKFALDKLPGQIAELEAKVASLSAKMAKAASGPHDGAAFAKLASELEAAQKALSAAEEQWLELEAKREELEGA